MNIDKIALIYFSPTGTTRRVLEGIARGMQAREIDRIDVTPPAAETMEFNDLRADCAIIGAPVYSGRVPLIAAKRLERIRVHGIPAVIVAVYGNRAYEDALLELKTMAIESGFQPVACGAFIGEHSFSSAGAPIAAGRPDETDMRAADDFGSIVLKKVKSAPTIAALSPITVPGNTPFKECRTMHGISPQVHEESCTACGICAEACPTGSIAVNGAAATNPDTCILCHACVKGCPEQALFFDAPPLNSIVEKLLTVCAQRRDPEVYL